MRIFACLALLTSLITASPLNPHATKLVVRAAARPTIVTRRPPIATQAPSTGTPKKVFAHFMIGNTYSMQSVGQYQTEIAKAISMGIDGFACNIGSDSWQPNRLSLMYQAAKAYPSFVLFVSLDMAVLGGTSESYFYQFITPYTSDSNQFKVNNKQFVSTFAGEQYSGSQSDPATFWQYFKTQCANQGSPIYFVPAFTGYGYRAMGWSALDGALSWNAWTKTKDEDNAYLLARSNPNSANPQSSSITTGYNSGPQASYSGKSYMAGIGPLFFTHFNYKNYVYSNDDLYNIRWENIISEQPNFVEIISWNDYGESHYIGDIVGSLPYDSNGQQSSTWANSNFDHTPLGTLTKFYITAYKNNAYPGVSSNTVIMWYRPHSINLQASADPYGRPPCQSATCPVDNIYVSALLTGPATVTITSGGVSQTFNGNAGLNKFQYVGFSTGAPSISVVMNGASKLSATASLAIASTIQQYNYNLHYDGWNF